MCYWGRSARGQDQLISIDGNATKAVVGGTLMQRISTSAHKLQNGKCQISIGAVTAENFGTWSCTLLDQTGVVFTGEVNIMEGKYCTTISCY